MFLRLFAAWQLYQDGGGDWLRRDGPEPLGDRIFVIRSLGNANHRATVRVASLGHAAFAAIDTRFSSPTYVTA